jgi:hypothetical protein
MTYSLNQLKEMIPIYLNGRLSEKEHAAFDEGLQRFPELEKELADFAEIQQSYATIEKEIPLDSDALFARIQNNIQKDAAQAPQSQIKAWFEQLRQKVADWYHTPALSWSLAGVQFAALLLVVMLIPQKQAYQTLTAPPVHADGIRINAVFHQEAKEIEIRTLLQQVGATIVDGPSATGLYVLEVGTSTDIDALIQTLTASGIVRLAEKALSYLERPQLETARSQPLWHVLTAGINRPATETH